MNDNCCFENATGLFPEADFTITSNNLYDEILINSNNVFYYSSNNSNSLYNTFSNTLNFSNLINKDPIDNYIYFNNSNNTIINSNSDLYVYHNSNFLIIGDESKYWNVEDKLTSNIIETNIIKFDFAIIQNAITSLTGFISTIQSEVSALEASDVAMAASITIIENQIQGINAIIAGLNFSLNSLYPLEIIDKNIQLNYNTEQFNLISSNLNIKSITQDIPANRPSYTNGILNQINDTEAYIQFIENGTITFPANSAIDILLVGAGGNGGAGVYGGGGGAGEVIYKTSYTISAGTYSIQIGQVSLLPIDRITRLYNGGNNLISAQGGGDGGYYDKITDDYYNLYLYKIVIARVNDTNNYTLKLASNRIIFNQGYIEINDVKDQSYPILATEPIYWYKLDVSNFLLNSGVYGGVGDLTNVNGVIIDNTNFIKETASAYFNSNNSSYLSSVISLNLRTLQSTNGFSISFWSFLKSTTNNNRYIFNLDNGVSRTKFLALKKYNNYLQLEVQDTIYTNIIIDDLANYFNNSWYFITITFSNTNEIKIYVNNEFKETITYILPNVSLTRLFIGGLGIDNSYFDGNIDDFRFYTSTLTITEIKELYNGAVIINDLPTSGGSGGGASINQSKGLKGTPFDIGSYLNDGYDFINENDGLGNQIDYGGGYGGSALLDTTNYGKGYSELITGNSIIVGNGGTGDTDVYYYPQIKTNYGDGGDGNGGNGYQGILIIKLNYQAPQTTFNGYTYWNKINNILTNNPISLNAQNQLQLNYDSTLTLNAQNQLTVVGGGGGGGGQWITTGNNIYNNNSGNVGIGISSPIFKLDVSGDIRASNLLVQNVIDTTNYKFNNNSLFAYQPANAPTYTNAIYNQIGDTSYNLSYTTNGTLTIPTNITCDCLVVGAGGRGGLGAYSGGGGAGEVVYYPNLSLLAGVYNIEVGVDSAITTERISKLRLGATDIIKANGGGDGGYIFIINSNQNIVIETTSLYNINYGSNINISAGTYSATFNNLTIIFNGITYYSYPILKDTNQNIINPIWWFKFNNNYTDSSTNNYTLTSTGTITLNSYDVRFATSSYLTPSTVPNIYNLWLNNGISFSCWIKPENTTGNYGNAWYFRTATGESISLNRQATSTNFQFRVDIGSGYSLTFFKNVFDGVFHHVVCIIQNNGLVQMYIDGVGLTGDKKPLNNSVYNEARIGKGTGTSSSNSYVGNIKDYRIYNKTLTESEVLELYKGRIQIVISAKSGGSGGGGALNQTAGTVGTPFNAIYSKLNAGLNGITNQGGDGGSATAQGRFESVIKGALSYYGGGGIGATSSSTPITKTYYGDGGDGNGGLGFQGIVIFKITGQYITQFLHFTDWNKLFNINLDNSLTLDTINNNLISVDKEVVNRWKTNQNSIYYNDGNVGIGTSSPTFKLDVNGDINSSNDYYLKGLNISNIFVTSNVLENTSNDLFKYSSNTSNDLFKYSSNTSNDLFKYSSNTSNDLFNYSSNNSNDLFNYTYNSSNDLSIYTYNSSNDLFKYTSNSSNINFNYTYDSSNLLFDYAFDSSNIISTDLSNYFCRKTTFLFRTNQVLNYDSVIYYTYTIDLTKYLRYVQTNDITKLCNFKIITRRYGGMYKDGTIRESSYEIFMSYSDATLGVTRGFNVRAIGTLPIEDIFLQKYAYWKVIKTDNIYQLTYLSQLENHPILCTIIDLL